MEWLNYHHLLYFWTVVREGSIVRACRQLHLAQPTISGQIKALEDALGEKLFVREGRRLVLTEVGRVVYRYADEIFSLGRELMGSLKDRPTGRPVSLVVGVADVLPKQIAYRLLAPALSLPESVHLICREDKTERLLAELSVHELDVVLTDAPLSSTIRIRAFSHLLGECGISLFASPKDALEYRRNFPRSLDGAPLLLPTDNTMLRRSLDQWFDAQGLRPRIVGEFEDSALLKVFGQAGLGVFSAPTVVAAEVQEQYGVESIGTIEEIRERFYAISIERKLKHPAVIAISEAAHYKLFKESDSRSSRPKQKKGPRGKKP